jgi:hypothetical protein
MSNPLMKFVEPWYPATALGLERGVAAMVQLEGGRKKSFSLRRAASVALGDALIRPGFDEPNITDTAELFAALMELATSAGLLRQRKWSIALPEATTRTLILTMESQPASRGELEEVLAWKMERGFGAPVDELSISRDRLPKDSQGRDRYLAVAVRAAVLAEYESVFNSLGWRTGLILPRHLGEARWLTRNGNTGDSLLVTSHDEGFTAAVFRDKEPLILRSIKCDPEEREDEFYRLLLFYRDRRAAEGTQQFLSRLLIVGPGFNKNRASEIASETLGNNLRALNAADVGLQLPASDLSFDTIAAAAGLATLHWR